jgi:hypothetical protein
LGKSSITFSSQPVSVAIGDFQNDNQLDFVVANSGTNTISIFLSNIDRSFTNQHTYSTGPYSIPYSVVVDDFNNDKYLDVAVANYGANSIGIFVGSDDGSFAEQNVFSIGSSRPLFIITGDFNNDNQADIAIVNYGTNNVGILLGYGTGSFQTQITSFTGYDSLPYSIAVADFNKDNYLDIVVANYGTNNIGVLLGFGNGSFEAQQTYSTTLDSRPSSIALGDFNNDNRLDIVVANYGTGNIGIFLGHGNGTFTAQITYSISFKSRPQFVSVGNFDNDNYLDVVVADSENDQVHILLGSGNGTFTTLTTYDGISESDPLMVAVADFNNDNRSDIVVANYGANNILVLRGYSNIPSARITNYFFGQPASKPLSVAIIDFDHDNALDIITNAVQNSVVVLSGYNNGTFVSETIYSTGNNSSPQYICASDLNNDSRMDIVTANRGSDSVGVLLGYGNGTFATVTTYSTGIGSAPWWVALGDVNNDNRLDIISANTGSSSIGILLGHSNGTFATVVTNSIDIGSTLYSVAVGDVNNDNRTDIVIPLFSTYNVGVLFGYGNGTFGEITLYSTGYNSYPISIALADLNGDNHLDIIVTNNGADNLGIFLGYGNGTFEAQNTYSTGSASQPYSVIVADFNNDNLSDIAATLFAYDEVVIFFGYGNGSFQLARTYSTGFGSHPYGIAVVDFNNDKQLEIVVALWGTGSVAILTEYHAAEFINQTTYSTGAAPQPYSVAIDDFNNDNRSDIVVANSGTDNLGILLGLGNGTFRTQMIYSLGIDSHPQYVITGDINKDGQIDIVAANSMNDSISVIMGYGNGTFAVRTMYSTGDGSYPVAIALGDVNNDNRSDLVIANEHTNSFGIFLGYDYALFQSQNTYSSAGTVNPNMIVVHDFNNDSYLDIAVTFSNSDNIGVLLGYGNGSFATMIIVSTGFGTQPQGLVVSDFNNDGRSDIAVSNSGSDNVGVLLGYSNGSFATMMTFSTGLGSDPYYVDVGDFNNDGHMDIVTANYGTNNIVIFLGYGNGSFAIVVTYSTGDNSSPVAVVVRDFNNDFKLDIAVANLDNHNVGILLGYGNGSFANQLTYFVGPASQPTWVAVGDFNSDNQLDIVVNDFNSNFVGILFGYGNGTFAAITTYLTGNGSTPISVSIGDFNNDNRLDIAVANFGSNNVVILFGFGDGTFLWGKPYSTGSGSQPRALAIGDFNNDTRLDIAVANLGSSNVGVFLGYGNELFAVSKTKVIADGSLPNSVALGDFDNDGQLDIVVANYGTNNVGIFLGLGNGDFDTMITYSTGISSAPYSVAVGDFNNDNQSDIVVTNSETDNIVILLGYGNGTFALPETYSTGARSRPYTVAITDFNNDNILDIVVANSGTNNVLLLYGSGNGKFENKESYSLGYDYRPYSIAIKDLNQDGWMDIVIACYNTDNVEILMKMCS